MAMTGTGALNRSQASAEAETGSVDSPVKECLGWIGVQAVYDDPWATPVTDCQVRIEVSGSIVADGPLTKGLSAFGKEDGQPHADVRTELGGYRQSGVPSGPALIALVPTGDPGQANDLEKQIYSQLSTFETSMRAILQPWIAEWSKHGWWSVPEAKRRGELRGLGAWWEGEVDFWASLSDVAGQAWDGIKSGARNVASWYEDLPWYEKASPIILISVELGKLGLQLWNGATELWDRRDQLMTLFKAFSKGSVAAIESALAALANLPGEAGELIKALVKDSADWVQNMIEVARETDVFKRAANTIMTVIMMMTPNFWAEGIGMVEGYLLPEVLITIILIIIGALCAAAGASALAARITGMLSKLRKAIGAAGKAGEVLTTLFSKLDGLATLVGNLSKALRRRIDETIKGVTDKRNPLVRRSAHRKPKLLPDGKIEPFPGSKHPPDPIQNKGYKHRNQDVTKGGHTVHFDKDGFPVFKSEFDTTLDDSHIGSRDHAAHFKASNQSLVKAAREDPSLAKRLGLTESDLSALQNSSNPPKGYTWHHHQDVGKMQLVGRSEHGAFSFDHTGGMSIWGGGYKK
ncbi:HNH endonuclease [Archangium violaceum]|uniref:HNH endonuclease n=1 Tax=Archangium violaceum TaxID=83451 RepID=UPI0009FC8B51|nr:HNH endonuclease [Archangium violaceum]